MCSLNTVWKSNTIAFSNRMSESLYRCMNPKPFSVWRYYADVATLHFPGFPGVRTYLNKVTTLYKCWYKLEFFWQFSHNLISLSKGHSDVIPLRISFQMLQSRSISEKLILNQIVIQFCMKSSMKWRFYVTCYRYHHKQMTETVCWRSDIHKKRSKCQALYLAKKIKYHKGNN